MQSRVPENTVLVLIVTLALWGGAAALAAFEGVFAKQSSATLIAAALFALLYAPATYFLDKRLRAWVASIAAAHLWAAALALDALLGAAALDLAVAQASFAPLARPAGAIAIFFFAPVALALHAALLDRAVRARSLGRLKRPAARSPGARPAAT
ncbi:MAG TPA: hypothetical protein VN878_07195 [Usitatibacter sp.]|nr:hypothetical protein [Usitatibacter sp.]